MNLNCFNCKKDFNRSKLAKFCSRICNSTFVKNNNIKLTLDGKICFKCKDFKLRNEFNICIKVASGLSSRCKLCLAEDARPKNIIERKELNKKKRIYYNQTIDIQKIRAKNKVIRKKKKILVAYGGSNPSCNCCNTNIFEFLTIDHLENNGSTHRREIKRSGGNDFYSWLILNNYPSGFQILCYNCNVGKYRCNGICPHQQLIKDKNS